MMLHPDPLATAMVARAPPGTLKEDLLTAAMVLNSTRIAAILRNWFPPDGGEPPRVTRADFVDILSVLSLRRDEEDQSGTELFDKHLDSGDGTVALPDLLGFVLGAQAKANGSGIGGIGGGVMPEKKKHRPRKQTWIEHPLDNRTGYAQAEAAGLAAMAQGLPALAQRGPRRQAHREEVQQARLEKAMYGRESGYVADRSHGPRPARDAQLGASLSAPALGPRQGGPPRSRHRAADAGATGPGAPSLGDAPSRMDSSLPALPPLPRPAIGRQVTSELKNPSNFSFGRAARPCVAAAPSTTEAQASPRARSSAAAATHASPSATAAAPKAAKPPDDAEAAPAAPLAAAAAGRAGRAGRAAAGGGEAMTSPREAAAAATEGRAGPPVVLGSASVRRASAKFKSLPRSTYRRDAITQGDLLKQHPSPDAAAMAAGVQAATQAAAQAAAAVAAAPGRSAWSNGRFRAQCGAVAALADAAQRERARAQSPTLEGQRHRLLADASLKVDDIVKILSDWDADFRGVGAVTRRDFRRCLPLVGLHADRAVADALFDFLVEETNGGIIKDAIRDTAASNLSPPSSNVGSFTKGHEGGDTSIDLGMLDRGLRWASGSKAKRSKLLKMPENASTLFNDPNKTVQEQLRETLSSNSLRVMDIFREWDENEDGQISREEFRKALPMLGLTATRADVDALFDEFDADGGQTISFRELNRQLRRDVKTERTPRAKEQSNTYDIIDVAALRRMVKQGLMNFAATAVVGVEEVVDPITGEAAEEQEPVPEAT